MVADSSKQQFKERKSTTRGSLMQEIWEIFASFFEQLILISSVNMSWKVLFNNFKVVQFQNFQNFQHERKQSIPGFEF